MKLLTLILGFILFQVGCAGSSSFGDRFIVRADQGAGVDQIAAIQIAVESWQSALGAGAHINFSSGACNSENDEVCIKFVPPSEIASITADTGCIGWTAAYPSNSVIFIPSVLPSGWNTAADLKQVIEHEMGHAMGLSHTQASTLMFQNAGDQAATPTCDDVAQWMSVRGQSEITTNCPQGGSFTVQ